ncbi:MAG: YARHG domain-containing protein [Firmicutes bacterium]|nr:YARHG domain-containing protein [Bacillota bacterium]
MSDFIYCPECGEKNAAGALFCENCGTPLDAEPEETVTEEETVTAEEDPAYEEVSEETERATPVGATEYEQPYVAAAAPKKKSAKIPIIIIVLLALAGAGAFAYFHFFHETEVDLTKNFDSDILEIQGYDGEGYIYGINEDMVRERWGFDNAKSNVQMFLETVEITTDKENDAELSNGDAVKIIVNYKKSDAEKYKIKVVGEEKTVRISGLQDADAGTDYYPEEESYDEDYDYSQNVDPLLEQACYSYLSEDELQDMELEDIQLLINYIFANNGYVFGKEEVQEYFNGTDWYDASNGTDSEKVAESRFSDIEKENLKLLKKVREEKRQ